MAASGTTVPSLRRVGAARLAAPPPAERSPWAISWSKPAALRALRATLVMPALFALTSEGMHHLQMALFAGFGGFATLVMASFGGTRRDRLLAHLGLAVAGSVALIIGTLASGTWWIAAMATLIVAFAIFFSGAISSNAASGANAALLAFVLPVASSGGAATIPDRLAGWWLASVVGTAAVLVISTAGPGDRLCASAACLATALAERLDEALRGGGGRAASRDATIAAKHHLMDVFTATPYRPTGLATADQALSNVVQVLEWTTGLLCDAFDEHLDLARANDADRDLLRASANVLRDVATLLFGAEASPELTALEQGRAASSAALTAAQEEGDPGGTLHAAAAHAAHAQAIAVAARTAAAEALIASRRADPETLAAERRQWYGGGASAIEERLPRAGALAAVAGVVTRLVSARSVWMVNSLRGAAALAAAVAVADVSGVQHAFWVVLGTMSVLRSNAAATGATAWRALAGTVVGFAAGAALLLAIGTGQIALWTVLPVAVLVASYAPGVAPFLFGQAAFTVTVAVLFNLLDPVGWTVGLIRVQDVAIGCAVSLVVGVLFWPRGAGGVVGADLADAFRRGGQYLTQAVDWATGARTIPPSAGGASVTAALRLDDALCAYLAEQGSKRVAKSDMWALVMGTIRLRLTANVLAGLQPCPGRMPGSDALRLQAAGLALYYERLADEVGSGADAVTGEDIPALEPGDARQTHPRGLWVAEHIEHLRHSARSIAEPAARFTAVRRRPWWR
jgi:Fusaric acid resistance protein-like